MYFAFLGTSAAVASAERDTTSLVFVSRAGAVLVDCGGGPVHRLRRLGLDPLALTHVVLTHIHPDHAYGLPSLVQNLVLLGRRSPLAVVLSFVPPVNSFAMLLRVASSTPPPAWQVWLSIGAGVAGAFGALWFAAKVFRVGILMFGKAPNFKTLIAWVRAA